MHESIRTATHAGGWYSSDNKKLSTQICNWLGNVDIKVQSVNAIIAPHAGYSHCGQCAAFSYKQVDPSKIKRIFVFGPSHHIQLYALGLTTFEKLQTPFYDLNVDIEMNGKLKENDGFEWVPHEIDLQEHSIEMQLPFIAKIMQGHKTDFKVVPIIIGSLFNKKLENYQKIFAEFLLEPENLFVISSDFCHWGAKFDFTKYEPKFQTISKYIEVLDKKAIDVIGSFKTEDFEKYLLETKNTICGRMAIVLLMEIVEFLEKANRIKKPIFTCLNYAQSNKPIDQKDFSVSYVAGVLNINKK